MSKKPFDKSDGSEVDMARRKFLKGSGAAIASGLAVAILAYAEGDENRAGEDCMAEV